MKNGKLYPVAYAGDLFLKRNANGNFYLELESQKDFTSVGIVDAIRIFCMMPNATIPFEAAFELE